MKCPICRTDDSNFKPYRKRPRARCPECGSLERHRAVFVMLVKLGLLSDDRRPRLLLSISADMPYQHVLQRLYFYQSISLKPRPGERKGSVTDLPYTDGSVDVVVQVHVMEHVKNDAKATREIFRVIRPGGIYVSCVPCEGPHTVEFGEPRPPDDHYRSYGQLDYLRLLERCGFRDVENEDQVFVARRP